MFLTGIWLTIYGYQKGLLISKLLGLLSLVCCVCGAPVGFLCFRYWRHRTDSANRDIELLSAEHQGSFDNIAALAARSTVSFLDHPPPPLPRQLSANSHQVTASAAAAAASTVVNVSQQRVLQLSETTAPARQCNASTCPAAHTSHCRSTVHL